MFARSVLSHSRRHPDRIALLAQDAFWTYQRLGDLIEHLAALLARVLGPDDAISIVMSPEGEAVGALLAADLSGHTALLLPAFLTSLELKALLSSFPAQLLVLPASAAGVAAEVEDWGTALPAPSGLVILSASVQDSGGANILGQDVLICQLTSGSTGPPRLAIRTRSGIEAEVKAVARELQLYVEDIVQCVSSPAHSYALVGGLLAPLSVGATAATAPSPAAAAQAIIRSRPTVVFGLPTTYQNLLQLPASDAFSAGFARLRLALSAGAPLPDGLFASLSDRFGFSVRQDYGTTETGTISIDLGLEPLPNRAGAPLSHMETRVVPPPDVALLPGESGEIHVRSVAVAREYLVNGHQEPCLDEHGWYHTGDLGRIDGAGSLWVGSRVRPPITIQGVAVRPQEIESVIERLPGVREALVIPVSGPDGRPALKAVVAASGVTPDEIRRWCADHLSAEHCPALVDVRDELPRSPAGKVLQKYLV